MIRLFGMHHPYWLFLFLFFSIISFDVLRAMNERTIRTILGLCPDCRTCWAPTRRTRVSTDRVRPVSIARTGDGHSSKVSAEMGEEASNNCWERAND